MHQCLAARLVRFEAEALQQVEPGMIDDLKSGAQRALHGEVDIDPVVASVEAEEVDPRIGQRKRPQRSCGRYDVEALDIKGRDPVDAGYRRHRAQVMRLGSGELDRPGKGLERQVGRVVGRRL